MPHTQRVFDSFEKAVIPRLKKMGCRSMLYVGWRRDCKTWWHDRMARELGGDLGVLEIFPRNIHDLEVCIWAGAYRKDIVVIPGDARKPELYVIPGRWDVIFWDHGPEHVTWEDLQEATPKLLEHAGKALVYCCPWGEWPQGEEDGNQHEAHRNSVTPEQLAELGFEVSLFGESGQAKEGELVGVMVRGNPKDQG